MSNTLWQTQLAKWVQLACELEVGSPKPGNVSPGCEFSNASVADFLKSADAIAPQLAVAADRSLGTTILAAVSETRSIVGHNTNLGIILLLSPLAAIPPEQSLFDGIESVLRRTTVADSRDVYEAIRLAQPAGLGSAKEQDLNDAPSILLRACMELAADRDMIARQYANGFREVLHIGLEWLRESAKHAAKPELRIQWLAVRLIAEFGDSLIERKCGRDMSDQVRDMAKDLLKSGWPSRSESASAYDSFDQFLRADGNRRNPGTTADLVAAVLFSALREGWQLHDRGA